MGKPRGPSPEGATPEQCPLPLGDAELKARLSAEQYHVTREGDTERPFANAYWNNKRRGLYVDIVTGEYPGAHLRIRLPAAAQRESAHAA